MRSVCVSLCLGESHGFVRGGEPTSATLERMRAFAGVYYEVTMVLTTSKKRDALWVKPDASPLRPKLLTTMPRAFSSDSSSSGSERVYGH